MYEMVQKTPKQQSPQRKFCHNSRRKSDWQPSTCCTNSLKTFADLYQEEKNILPIGTEWNSWSFESRPEALATKINAYACYIAHKRPGRGRLVVFSVSVVKFYGSTAYMCCVSTPSLIYWLSDAFQWNIFIFFCESPSLARCQVNP